MRWNWNWYAGYLTGIAISAVIGALLIFGLLWGMIAVAVAISAIILGQNALFFMVARFARKHDYHTLKNWVIGFWVLISVIIALFFVLIANSTGAVFWWWFGTSLMLIGIEFVLFLLASFIADN
jgi:hypothetical protein